MSERTVYLALMPGKRKAKAVAPSALEWYKANARRVWAFEGTADAARARLWPWADGATDAEAAARIATRAKGNGEGPADLARRLPRCIGGTDYRAAPAAPEAPALGTAAQVPASLCVSMAPHATLHRVYDVAARRHVPPAGCVPGEYGPEDPKTGAAYKVLGERASQGRHGDVSYSRDYEPGSFYPPAPFLWGEDANGGPLGFDALEAVALKLGWNPTAALPYGCQRVLLPRGTEKGRQTWQPALKHRVFEVGHQAWYPGASGEPGPAGRIRAAFPGAEVQSWNVSTESGRVDAFLPAPGEAVPEATATTGAQA